jgi:hypothetical protein
MMSFIRYTEPYGNIRIGGVLIGSPADPVLKKNCGKYYTTGSKIIKT